MILLIFSSLALLFFTQTTAAADNAAPKPAGDAAGGKNEPLMRRIDFGNAYITGQTIKSGAVYLLHRKQSDIESMLKIRTHYRREIQADYAVENFDMDSGHQPVFTENNR